MDSLSNVVRLEEENRQMKTTIRDLLTLKEESIVSKFNLEKRLKEQLANVDKITEKEKYA